MTNTPHRMPSEGKTGINGWKGIPSAIAGETLAGAVWDGITCDMQHGLMAYANAIRSQQGMARFPLTLNVHIPRNEPSIIGRFIGRFLDCGAMVSFQFLTILADMGRLINASRAEMDGVRAGRGG